MMRSRWLDLVKDLGEAMWLLAYLGRLDFDRQLAAKCLLTLPGFAKAKIGLAPLLDDLGVHQCMLQFILINFIFYY